MNHFAISSMLAIFSGLLMAIFVFLNNIEKKSNKIWVIFCLTIFFGGIGGLNSSTSSDYDVALFWLKVSYIGVFFAPPLFYHFVLELLDIKRRPYVKLSYFVTSGLFVLNWFRDDLFFGRLKYVHEQFYFISWNGDNFLYLAFYVIFYWIFMVYTYVLLFKHFKLAKWKKKQQIKYIFLGVGVGWIGTHGCFFTVFFNNIYPYTSYLIALFPIVITYAIFKHQLMDINIVIKKGLVYSVLVAIVTMAYFVFVMALGGIFQRLFGSQSFLINLFAVFVIGLLFNPLRDHIQRFLDKRFFQGTLESLAQDRLRLQQELFHKEKLAYVGQLASSVVHEIRNPLTTLETFMQYVPEKHNDPEFLRKFQELMPKEMARIKKVVTSLLNLSKPASLNFEQVNICHLLNETLTLLEEQLNLKKILVKKYFETDSINLKVDQDQIRQVFLNLLLNAI